MCGIAGLVGSSDRDGAAATVRDMVAALSRRGPDGSGVDCWDAAVLGHRRLAIFDLSEAGHQPMLSDDRAVAVVFNGAIYNFPALRAELIGHGRPFRSHTDTEVLVHGYRQWGIDGLVRRLRGMFAFALWDEAARRLYLVRDRLGVKPLAYACRGGEIAFASTVRALRAGRRTGDIDARAVAEFLEFGFVTEDRTIYEGAAKVPPASIVEWTPRGISVRPYWAPPDAAEAGASFDDAVAETERLLLRAVEVRLHADVPVGALLSGGVDSGLVCWAISKLGGDITAFTVGTPGHEEDETRDARATAAELGIRHEVLALAQPDPADIRDLAAAYAEPFACASALGMIRISRAIAQSPAKVLLTGDGGDDVFLGYPRHRHLLYAQRLARLTPPAIAAAWRALRRERSLLPGVAGRAAHFLDYATGGLGAFIDAHDGLPSFRRKGFLGDRLNDASVPQRALPWSLDSARRSLADYLRYDLRTQFVSEYLTKVDGATMYHALEARSPFLDQELWEFASRLPFGTRLSGGRLKAVLRELARRRIGARIARGRKRGFGVPVARWLAGPWRAVAEDRLRTSVLAREGWVRADAVLAELSATPETARVSSHLWYVLVLEEWMRHERETAIPRAGSERRPARAVGV